MISLLFYNIGIRLYYIGIYIASFFNAKAKTWIKARHRLQTRFHIFILSAHERRIWFHCASLGEFEQVRPLIEKIRLLYPDDKLILTFFSPSGFEARRYYTGVDYVGYLPLDTAAEAHKFVSRMRPSLAVWVKYEYWYHHLAELKRMNVPTILISSVFRPDHIFFRWYGGLHRKILTFFTHIFVQNEASKAQLSAIGIDSEVCADTRFDRVYNIMTTPQPPMDGLIKFKGDKKILIAGSTWTKDVDLLCELINNDPFQGQFKYIIAPHDVTKENIQYLLSKITKRKAIFSRITVQNADNFDVAIIDSTGLLAKLYGYGEIAYVGGGFDASVHNVLEPAVYGMPVIFGPNYHKSEEAKTLLAHTDWHTAYTIKTSADIISAIRDLLANDEAHLNIARIKSKEYVLAHTGGTEQIYGYLKRKGIL